MNRQRKFKVWDKLAQRMIYPDKGYQQHYILDLYGRFHNLQNGSGGDEYVVLEYTGLKDSKGTDIYEGDIYYDKIYKAYCQCIWDVERLTYRWVGKNMSLPIGPRDDDMSVEVKIVGNIFKHSELLK